MVFNTYLKNTKKIVSFFFILSISLDLHAEIRNDFSYAMQDLTKYVACLGKYNYAEANLDYEPSNFYKENMIAERLSLESGKRTVTHTFYGVCFDYAYCALVLLEKSNDYYVSMGMKKNCYYMADTPDSGKITIAIASKKNNADRIQNGVPLKNIETKQVFPHKDSFGVRASNHAWVWVQRQDGVWFWLDPTWTDNLGYIVWGYVKDGEEIQLKPDKKFCINYPYYLNSLPEAPEIKDEKQEIFSDYRIEPCYFIMTITPIFSFIPDYQTQGGVKLSGWGAIDFNAYINFPIEVLWRLKKIHHPEGGVYTEDKETSFLVGIELGKQIVKFKNNKSIGFYGLGSIGLSHKAFLKPNSYITDVKDEFSYKFGGGTFFQIERFVFSAAYSYSKTLNSAIEFSIAYGHTGTSVVRYIK